jgi:formylglycine-generating enzyme required for sulfatase activity
MCWVPRGTFMMGTPFDASQPKDGPARRVRISHGYYLDQYEVTIGQFAKFLRETSGAPCTNANNYCGTTYAYFDEPFDARNAFTVRPGMERLPIVASLAGAEAYCNWVGKRLPSGAEWEYAARHDPATNVDHTYPWGDDVRAHPPEATRNDASPSVYRSVGAVPGDRSPVGAYDMGGNATEWVADCFTMNHSCAEPCTDPVWTTHCEQICSEGSVIECERGQEFRGGDTLFPSVAAKVRGATMPSDEMGFRCLVPADH